MTPLTFKELNNLSLIEKVRTLQNMLISRATGGNMDNEEYQLLRRAILNDSTISEYIPSFIKNIRDENQFWQMIKPKFGDYDKRRQYIYDEFSPLLEKLETDETNSSTTHISQNLQKINNVYIHDIWQKALNRKTNDPEGAITMARTLVESVCKHILDSQNIEYNNSTIELSELYKLVAKELNLAPEQHQESIFKQILGGCSGIVNGLGTLRNKLGDTHGAKGQPVKPSTRHAELAVNLSGAMSVFLLDTYHVNKI